MTQEEPGLGVRGAGPHFCSSADPSPCVPADGLSTPALCCSVFSPAQVSGVLGSWVRKGGLEMSGQGEIPDTPHPWRWGRMPCGGFPWRQFPKGPCQPSAAPGPSLSSDPRSRECLCSKKRQLAPLLEITFAAQETGDKH